MSVPTLKQFNRLLEAAASEVEAWRHSKAAESTHSDRINYLQDLLGALQGSVHVGSLSASVELAVHTVESLGVSVESVSHRRRSSVS